MLSHLVKNLLQSVSAIVAHVLEHDFLELVFHLLILHCLVFVVAQHVEELLEVVLSLFQQAIEQQALQSLPSLLFILSSSLVVSERIKTLLQRVFVFLKSYVMEEFRFDVIQSFLLFVVVSQFLKSFFHFLVESRSHSLGIIRTQSLHQSHSVPQLFHDLILLVLVLVVRYLQHVGQLGKLLVFLISEEVFVLVQLDHATRFLSHLRIDESIEELPHFGVPCFGVLVGFVFVVAQSVQTNHLAQLHVLLGNDEERPDSFFLLHQLDILIFVVFSESRQTLSQFLLVSLRNAQLADSSAGIALLSDEILQRLNQIVVLSI